jgi:capsular polysaccharide biosynthesis protein
LTLRTFVAAVRRFRVTFLLVVGAVLILGVTAILLLPNRFVSSTRLMVSVAGSTTASAYQNDGVAARRVNSYIPLLTSGVVTQRVIDKLGLPLAPSELTDKIGVANVPPKTSLIDIEVTDDSPDRARRIADTLASEFISYAASIETPTGEDSHKVDTTVVTPATQGRANLLEPVFLYVLAAIAALLLGAVAVWIRAARETALPPAEPDGDGDVADGDCNGDRTEDALPTDIYAPAPPKTVEATEPVAAD